MNDQKSQLKRLNVDVLTEWKYKVPKWNKVDSLSDQNLMAFWDKSKRSVKLDSAFREKVCAIEARVSIYKKNLSILT